MLQIFTSPFFYTEKEYVCNLIFGELLGIAFEILPRPDIEQYQIRLPNGSALLIEDHFFKNHRELAYLEPGNVPGAAIQVPHPFEAGASITSIFGRHYYSQTPKEIIFGVDLFASAFFMLTRWEEYARPDRDTYGRFPAAAALAVRAGFIDRPVVNEYAELIWQMLVRLGWSQPRKSRTARLHLSHDIDHPRLWWTPADRARTLAGSLFRRKNPREAAWWIRHHLFRPSDPYDIFEDWMAFSEANNIAAHFNFLSDRPPESDCYYPLQHPFIRNLIKKITERGHTIGFHPSREAFANPQVFQRELDSLRRISPQPVLTGRQHYLCFSAPHTWQRWEDAGMKWDSTLGYSELEGFRCGICQEFPVFNFLTRKTLLLREKPLLAMDVTLAQYRRYSPAQGYDRLQALSRQVKKHGGEFVLLWHNSSWNTYFWAPWQEVYTEFVRSC